MGKLETTQQVDAIVIGSGITGGWAAKAVSYTHLTLPTTPYV